MLDTLKRRLRQRREQVIRITTEESWELLLRGLKCTCVRVNGEQELMVKHFDGVTGLLYGLPWDGEANDWDGRPETVIPVDTIRNIHIL